jgi:hypothetical protein
VQTEQCGETQKFAILLIEQISTHGVYEGVSRIVAAEHECIGPLRIVVCIKQVPLLSALRFDAETRRLVREGVALEVNELNIYALFELLGLCRILLLFQSSSFAPLKPINRQ